MADLGVLLAIVDLKPFLVLGLALGGVYAVSGVGLVVLYRATGVLNLAYGGIGALSALVAWSLINSISAFDFPDALAYVVALAFGALASLLYGVLIGPPLALRDPLVKMIGTLGFALILLGIMSWVWNPVFARSLRLPTTAWNYSLGDVRVSWTQIIAFAFGILMTAGTALFLRKTKLGTAMRSLADNREITAMLGVPVRRVEAAAWLGSGFLCGAAGLLLSDLVRLDGVTLTFLVISSLAAALVGQLRSLWGTLIGALAIGVFEACGTAFNAWAPYKTMTPFLIAIIALLWFGRRRVLTMTSAVTRGTSGLVQVSSSRFALWKQAESVRGITRGTLLNTAIAGGLLTFMLLAFPSLVGTRWELTFTTVPIYAVVALGAGFLYGRVGLISLGQIALFGVGSWVALRLLWGTSLPYPVVILITGIITMVIGTVIGLPALRLSGLHLALITLMGAAAIGVILRAWNFPNGGSGFKGVQTSISEASGSVRRPDIAPSDTAYYRYVLVVCALMFLLVLWHIASRPGRAWAALRQSEAAALAGGVNVTLYKVWAFALASFITGVAGAALAATGGGILNSFNFQTQDSIVLVAVALMAGVYSVWGAVLAGVLLRFLPELLKDFGASGSLLVILFGVGVIQVILTAPGGIVDQFPKDMAKLGRFLGRRVGRVTGARGPAAP
jgi:branched-subunit amino acid ABC-type transport system permease component